MAGVVRLGWGVFVLLGMVAAAMPLPYQLGYAAAGIGLLGLPHGASDLALVPPPRRSAFLVAYMGCVAAVLICWIADPLPALAALLLLSAVHFGLEDAPATQPLERVGRGLLMVAGPALLHRADLCAFFTAMGIAAGDAAALATVMRDAAIVSCALLPAILIGMLRAGDRAGAATLGLGAAALLLAPPLPGFAIGFVLLHARAQLGERMAAIGSARVADYLRATGPILVGAAVTLAALATLFAVRGAPPLSTLFAGIAALAIPHMLVTPLWTAPPARPLRGEPAGIAARAD